MSSVQESSSHPITQKLPPAEKTQDQNQTISEKPPPIEADQDDYRTVIEPSLVRVSLDHTLGMPARTLPVVPGYEIQSVLGRGGMGVVYKAIQVGLQRPVALKMILGGDHVSEERRARFQIEAKAVARLDHANIVRIYDIGEHDGLPYFSLEYVDGGTLERKLATTTLTPLEAAGLLEQLARGMHVAHTHDIIHRDLKPGNVLLARDGTPKITDFGLAKQLDGETAHTLPGAIFGTPPYMPPEQAEGKTDEILPPADIYSLGAILYETLTGRPPFKAETTRATLIQVVQEDPVPPSRLQKTVPRDLETICLKCLEKGPGRRYASALELAEDLRRFSNHEPILARPTPAWEWAWKFTRRRPWQVALVAVLIAVVFGTLGFFAWHSKDLKERLIEREDEVNQLHLKEEKDRQRKEMDQEREKVKDLFSQGQGAMVRQDWQGAVEKFGIVKDMIASKHLVPELKVEVKQLDEQARQHLDEAELKVKAHQRFENYKHQRDEALYHASMATGLSPAANVQKTRETAKEALDLSGVMNVGRGLPLFKSNFLDEHQKQEIHSDCYELLLVWAEAVAHALDREDPRQQAREALEILKRLEQLGYPLTKAYHLRRFRYCKTLKDEVAAQKAQAAAKQAPANQAVDFFMDGMDLISGNPALALIQFQEALVLKPNNFWAQYDLAVCHLRLREFGRAWDSLTACLGHRRDNPWVYVFRGVASGQLGGQSLKRGYGALAAAEFGAAEADFEEAWRLYQTSGRPNPIIEYGFLLNRGTVELLRDRPERAVPDFEQAAKVLEEQYQAYVNLGMAYEAQAKAAAARQNDQEAGRKLDEAVAQLQKAIQRAPDMADLYRTRAQLHFQRKDWLAALTDLDKAMVLALKAGKAERRLTGEAEKLSGDHVLRGRIFLEGKLYADAVTAFTKAIEESDQSALAFRLHGMACLARARSGVQKVEQQELLKNALRSLDQYLQKKGIPDAEFYWERGLAKVERHQHAEDGIDDYTLALAQKPDATRFVARGWVYVLSEAPRLAQRDFEEALQLEPDPKNGDVYNGLGYARVRLARTIEEVREAGRHAEEALKRGPETPDNRYKAARIFAQAAERSAQDPREATRYREKANQRLREAINLSRDKAKEFWRQTVHGDAGIKSIRDTTEFRELERRMEKP